MEKIKCAIVIPGFLPVPAVEGGAVEVLIEEIIKGNELNHVFDFDLYTISNNKIDNEKYKFCKIVQLKYNFLDILKGYLYKIFLRIRKNDGYSSVNSYIYALKAKKYINKKNYDKILIENNMKIYELFRDKKNIIFHLHNDILGPDKPRYLCEDIIKNCNSVITVSDYLTNKMKEVKCGSNIFTLHNCIDLNDFNINNFTQEQYEAIRDKYHIKKDDFVFVYTGRIVDEKGIFELCSAFSKYVNIHPNSKLIIVGSGNFLKNNVTVFEKKLHSNIANICDKVIFTGYINHNLIPQILYISNCVVIPSKWEEPFGVVGLEAMAMKKVIIATESGGLTEMLTDKNSILVNKDKNLTENLYMAMDKICKDENLRNTISENAYNDLISNSNFNKDNYFKNFVKLTIK